MDNSNSTKRQSHLRKCGDCKKVISILPPDDASHSAYPASASEDQVLIKGKATTAYFCEDCTSFVEDLYTYDIGTFCRIQRNSEKKA